MQEMKYFTLEEAAKLLSHKPTREWLVKQMIDPDKRADNLPGSFLTPSVYFDKPTLLRSNDTGSSGWFSGWFEIEGLYESGKIRNGEICFEGPSRYLSLIDTACDPSKGLLSASYYPCGSLKIHLGKLHVRHDELESFARSTGREIETLKTVRDSGAGTRQSASIKRLNAKMKLPIVGNSEVIPLRLIPYVTAPSISQHVLLEHLYNPRGDYSPQLCASSTDDPWVKIAAENWRVMYEGEEDGLLPSDVYILKADFEDYHQFRVDGEKPIICLSHMLADDVLTAAFEGFQHFGYPESLLFMPVSTHGLVEEIIEIPFLENEAPPVKQYPGRIYSDRNVPVEEYIKRRRNDKPPATDEDLVYELRDELKNVQIMDFLGLREGKSWPSRKKKAQDMFTAAAKKRGTADEVIKGRGKKTP